jgi:hypothetical protein
VAEAPTRLAQLGPNELEAARRVPSWPDSGEATLGVRGPVCEQAVVCFVPRCEAVVEPGSPAEIGIDFPGRERAVEQPCVVERGIAQARVAPIDHAGEPAVAHE